MSIVGIYVGLRLWVIYAGNVYTSFDTFSYVGWQPQSIDHVSLVSLTGDAPRLWGVPAFYALFADNTTRVVAQWTVGTVCWVLLAIAVAGYFRHSVTKALAYANVLALALLPQVSSWDLAILSESLSLSLGAGVLALLLIWTRTRSTLALMGLAMIAVWWIFIRPETRLYVGALVIALIVVEWRIRNARQTAGVGVVCLVLVASCAWCTLIMPRVNIVHGAYSSSGLTYHDALVAYRLRLHVFPDPATRQVFIDRLDMPECPGASAVAARATWDGDDFIRELRNCSELADWTRQNASALWPRFALASPGRYMVLLWQLEGEALAGTAYAEVPAVLSGAAERLWFPSRRHSLAFLLVAIVAVGLAIRASRARRIHRSLICGMLGLGATAMLGGFAVVTWGAGEYSRFGLVPAVSARFALGVLALTALDAVLQNRRTPSTRLPLVLLEQTRRLGTRVSSMTR